MAEWPGVTVFDELPLRPPLLDRYGELIRLAIGDLDIADVHAQLAELAIGTLLRRFPDFSGNPEPPAWHRSMILRGPERLPLRLG